jgi:hypothetical protein
LRSTGTLVHPEERRACAVLVEDDHRQRILAKKRKEMNSDLAKIASQKSSKHEIARQKEKWQKR